MTRMGMRPATIDIHTHILPPELPKGGAIQLDRTGCSPCEARMVRDDGTVFRKIESNCWDPARRKEECSRYGVTHQVLSTVPVMFNYGAKAEHALDWAMFLNDHLAGVIARDPLYFSGLATLPMQSPKLAVRELERCMKSGLSGAQIGTHCGSWNLDAPEIFEVLQAAENLGAAVFVHPWDMLGQDRMTKYWLPWLVGMPAELSIAICSMIFGGVFERLPKLRVAFAHGGGAFPGTLGRIDHGFHARPDLCATDCKISPREHVGKFYVDSLVHDARALSFLVDTFGVEKIALGTDYPFPLGEGSPGALIHSLKLSPVEEARLLSGTAKEWLGL